MRLRRGTVTVPLRITQYDTSVFQNGTFWTSSWFTCLPLPPCLGTKFGTSKYVSSRGGDLCQRGITAAFFPHVISRDGHFRDSSLRFVQGRQFHSEQQKTIQIRAFYTQITYLYVVTNPPIPAILYLVRVQTRLQEVR